VLLYVVMLSATLIGDCFTLVPHSGTDVFQSWPPLL
jgi:hypothetical protein